MMRMTAKKKKFTTMMLSLTLVFSMLSGCGKKAEEKTESTDTQATATTAPESSSEVEYKDEIHIALDNVPTNLDIMMNTATVATQVTLGSVFEQLLTIDENYQPQLELAESFSVNDDFTEYEYKLRQGVLFHNGEEMKADDVVASLNRWIDNAGNAQAMVGESRFEKVDDYTVKISLSTSCAYLNDLIAGLGQRSIIIPKSVIDAADPETGIISEYIGTGPYKFDSWVTDQYIKLTRNDDYKPYGTEGQFSGWGGYKHAYTKDIYFDLITDASTILAGMQTGEYDATNCISSDNFSLFDGDSNYDISYCSGEQAMLIFNKAEGLGADEKIRQAVAASIDCDSIMAASYGSNDFYELYPGYMYKEQSTWYTEAGSEYYNQNNPEKAKEILADAGYNGEPFTILVASDNQEFYNMAIVVKDQLEKAGMTCELLTYDWSTFVSVRNNEPDKYNAFITSFTSKPIPTMNLFLSSTWAGWVSDTKILDTLSAINSDTNKENAVASWVELQQYMNETSVPVVKFGTNKSYMIAKSSFEDLGYMEHIIYVNAKLKK